MAVVVAIPLATTTITVIRREMTDMEDLYDPADYPSPEWTTIVAGVRAVISPPTANPQLTAGTRLTWSASLRSDPCDLQENDHLIDANDGTEWTVLWAREFDAIGLNHMEASLRMVQGFAQ